MFQWLRPDTTNTALLKEILAHVRYLERIMSEALDRLNADITAQTTIIGGFDAAMKGLAQQIRDLATNSNGATPEQLHALADAIEANNTTAQAALQANVGGTPPTP